MASVFFGLTYERQCAAERIVVPIVHGALVMFDVDDSPHGAHYRELGEAQAPTVLPATAELRVRRFLAGYLDVGGLQREEKAANDDNGESIMREKILYQLDGETRRLAENTDGSVNRGTRLTACCAVMNDTRPSSL